MFEKVGVQRYVDPKDKPVFPNNKGSVCQEVEVTLLGGVMIGIRWVMMVVGTVMGQIDTMTEGGEIQGGIGRGQSHLWSL